MDVRKGCSVNPRWLFKKQNKQKAIEDFASKGQEHELYPVNNEKPKRFLRVI